MKRFANATCFFALTLLLATPLFGQVQAVQHPHVPAGTLPPIEEVAAAATTFGGTFVFNITITIKSSIPTTTAIWCGGTASLSDGASSTNPLGGRQIIEEAAVAATRSGNSATCKVTIPYSWALTTSSTDKVNLIYIVATGGTSTAAGAVRLSEQGLGSIAVPLTGSTTTETIASTI